MLFTSYPADNGKMVIYEGKTKKGDEISVQFARPYSAYSCLNLKNVQRTYNQKKYVLIPEKTLSEEAKWPEIFPFEKRQFVSLWVSTTFPADIIYLDNDTQEVIATISDRGEIIFPQKDPNKCYHSINFDITTGDLKCFSQLGDLREVLILEDRSPNEDRDVEVRLLKCINEKKEPLSFVKRKVVSL